MKALLIFPPQWHPATPYLSVPLLVAQLEAAGIQAEGWDLNVEFYNDILTAENIQKTVDSLKYDLENKIGEKEKLNEIEKVLNYQSHKITQSIKYIEEAKRTLKSNDFYNPILFLKAKKIINYALELISLKYYPTKLSLSEFSNKDMPYTYEGITQICTNPEKNIFYDYIKNKIKEKGIENYDYIGISVAHTAQLLASFTLGKLIKDNHKSHISFGGNLVTRIKDLALKHTDIFDTYLDTISLGNGENSIIQLSNAINKNGRLEEVEGLMYKNEQGNININPVKQFKSLSTISSPSFTGYNLTDYFIPQIIIPLQLAKGCYWSKCTFCDFHYGRNSFISDTAENIVNKLETLKEKYNIANFEFVDAAVHPTFYEKLADEIIKRKLDISFYSMARAEKEFTPKILKKLKKAGLKMLFWGVESASEKVIDLMQKGINIKETKRILKDSANQGIWNHTYFMLGFPKETPEDATISTNFILKNNKIIDSFSAQPFTLSKHSIVSKTPEKFNIYQLEDTEEFLPNYDFEYHYDVSSYLSYLHNSYIKKEKLTLWKILTPDEYLFLYVIKYGRKWVKKFHFDEKKAHIPKF